MSIAYYHTTCGELLVFYKQDTPPTPGQLIREADWQLPNGNLISTVERAARKCPKCGETWSFTSTDLTPNFTPPA